MSYWSHTSTASCPQRVDLSAHLPIHVYEWRPWADGAFASKLVSRVNSDLTSDTNLACRVVEHVCRTFRKNAIALGVGVRAEPKEHFAGVMDVHVGVDHHDVFGEHHLSHAPEAVHYFIGLHGITLFDADKHQIVKHTFGGQSDIHDFGEVQLQDRQKEPHAGRTDVEVFHRWGPDDGGRIDRVLSMGDGRDVKNGIRLGQGIVASMIAEGTFIAQRF